MAEVFQSNTFSLFADIRGSMLLNYNTSSSGGNEGDVM